MASCGQSQDNGAAILNLTGTPLTRPAQSTRILHAMAIKPNRAGACSSYGIHCFKLVCVLARASQSNAHVNCVAKDGVAQAECHGCICQSGIRSIASRLGVQRFCVVVGGWGSRRWKFCDEDGVENSVDHFHRLDKTRSCTPIRHYQLRAPLRAYVAPARKQLPANIARPQRAAQASS